MSELNYKKLKDSIHNMKRGDKLSTFLITELSTIDWFALRFTQNNIIKIINNMKRHQPFYKTIKEGMTKLGWWKLKQRGNPQKGFKTGLGKSKENKID